MLTCQLPLNASPSSQDRRFVCAQLILQWKGELGVDRVDLKAQDMVCWL